jgi:cyclase
MKIQHGFKKAFLRLLALNLLLCTLCATAMPSDSVKTGARTVTKLAEGVYMIRHRDSPDTFPQGNTTVIIGERDVMVVDSCYLPSSAREDIAQIRQWTNKPVRYLLNTHWHFDHTMGNGTYVDAFPQLTIIAHTETARQIAGYNPGWFERFPQRADRFKQILESGKNPNGKPLTEAEKKEYLEAIAGIEPVQAEFKSIKDRAPTLTFSDELNIDLGGRQVQVKHLGRGNTAGDALAYLPKEKIVITGDLVVRPVPYMFGGYPADFIKTLQRVAQLDTQTLVPGHGEVLQGDAGKAYMNQIADLMRAVVSQVSLEVHRIGGGPRNMDAVKETVLKNPEMNVWRRKFAGEDKDSQDMFDNSLLGLITSSFAEVWGR